MTVVVSGVAIGGEVVSGRACAFPDSVRISHWATLILCIVAFSGGRLAGYLRAPARNIGMTRWIAAGSLLTDAVMVAVYFLVIPLLAYDAYALLFPGRVWPLAYYLRCVIDLAPVSTSSGAAAVSFLLGHWFWYPARRLP